MKRPASWLSNVPIFMQIDAREVCFHGCQLLTTAFLDLRFSAQMASFPCATTPPHKSVAVKLDQSQEPPSDPFTHSYWHTTQHVGAFLHCYGPLKVSVYFGV